MSFRVCIPTAGTGSRLGSLTQFINKALIGIANRPILSHLIEQFPADAQFVVALGYKGHLVREFLELAYPRHQFIFAEVQPFDGPGSGLGLSLLSCREHLEQPFIFISCDTLVTEDIPLPDTNWMAYSEVECMASYRTIMVENGKVTDICEKGAGKNGFHKPYIGLAGIHDYQTFWSFMENGDAPAVMTGEVFGLRGLLPLGIHAYAFNWNDTGNLESLAHARKTYQEHDAPNILEKANEAIWFVDQQVIKFSDDQKFIANRVKRVSELKGFVPEITSVRPHMFSYSKVNGRVLSEVVTLTLFEKLLEFCTDFWKGQTLNSSQAQCFRDTCKRFYRDKTFERIELFYKNFSRRDGTESINGITMPKLEMLLQALDWNQITEGLPGRFHGDFHFENILWSADDQRFTFLDWRQDFGGELSLGDIYYDLAKLMHGLIVCHDLISKELYKVKWQSNEITYDFHRKHILVECERHFEQWIKANQYDFQKVRILTALIYLNIAALHHYPYSLLLFALGKAMLNNESER